jgi:hypothetical protein
MTAEINARSGTDNIAKIKPVASQKDLRCRGCGNVGISRIKRSPFVKTLFFWLPLKRYVCYRCNRKTYRINKSA